MLDCKPSDPLTRKSSLGAFVLYADIVYSWSAVARGAVCKGLEGDDDKAVTNRKCRRHYGTACTQAFDKEKHNECDSFICQFEGSKRARGQMSWLLKRGDNLATCKSSHANAEFHLNFWPGKKRVFDLTLYSSETVRAPKRVTSKVCHSIPILNIC